MARDFRRFIPYLVRHRWKLAIGVACMVMTNGLDVQLATLMGTGLDLVAQPMGILQSAQKGLLAGWAGMVLAMALGAGATRYWMRWLIIGVSRDVEFAFRNDFFARLLSLPPPFYDRTRTGDIMSRATSDMDAIRTVIGPCIMYLANTMVMVPMTVTKMVLISPVLTAICWLPMALLMPMVFFFKKRINARFRRVQELMSDLSANVQETFSGIRVIKTCAREAERAEAFDRVSDDYVTANMRLARLQSVFMPMLGAVIGLSLLVMVAAGGVMIIRGALSIGNLMTFFLLLGQSVWPVAALGWVLAQMERGAASMARVEEIMNLPDLDEPTRSAISGDHPDGKAQASPVLSGRIAMRDLTFAYPGAARPALRGLTLAIPEGSTLGITGPVGCGKSTLAHLLARRYDPPRGALWIDGRDVLDWPTAALRRQIGIVDQEPFLFSDAIAANILFGVEDAGTGAGTGEDAGAGARTHAVAQAQGGWRALPAAMQERLLAAARVAHVEDEIRGFAGDFDALLGERGINLSGGQRQRVALARALARDPALLILDDALAAVDSQTEAAILRGLRQVLGSRTTILIGHRVSTMQLADCILYLEDGAMAESGSHEELLDRRGKYWQLAERQKLAEEIERTA
jgi:ATP-binding cassette subfamily B protein